MYYQLIIGYSRAKSVILMEPNLAIINLNKPYFNGKKNT